MSKGSSPRPYSVDQKTFSDNWDKIFSKSPKEIDDAKAEDEAFEQIKKKREKALQEMVRINEQLGLYDEYDSPNRNTSNF